MPSPFDRSFALKEGQITVEWINNIYEQCPGKLTSPGSAVMLGLKKNNYIFTQIEDLKPLIVDG